MGKIFYFEKDCELKFSRRVKKLFYRVEMKLWTFQDQDGVQEVNEGSKN